MKIFRRLVTHSARTCGYEIRKLIPADVRRKAELAERRRSSWQCITQFDIGTIVDIGANVGQFAAVARGLLPSQPIVSFEPLQDCYDQLVAKKQSLAPFYPIHSALGKSSGQMAINRSDSTASSSFLKMGERHMHELPHTAVSHAEMVSISVLDEALPPLGLPKPYFVKIDVQGFELDVLQGATESLKDTTALVVEVSAEPMYHGEPGFDAVYGLLREHGFKFCGTVDQWRSEKTGQILQFDCLFKKSQQASPAIDC